MPSDGEGKSTKTLRLSDTHLYGGVSLHFCHLQKSFYQGDFIPDKRQKGNRFKLVAAIDYIKLRDYGLRNEKQYVLEALAFRRRHR